MVEIRTLELQNYLQDITKAPTSARMFALCVDFKPQFQFGRQYHKARTPFLLSRPGTARKSMLRGLALNNMPVCNSVRDNIPLLKINV